jgi:hypothetical protein
MKEEIRETIKFIFGFYIKDFGKIKKKLLRGGITYANLFL